MDEREFKQAVDEVLASLGQGDDQEEVRRPFYGFALDEQAIRGLELVAEFLPRADDDPYMWKWVVNALHDALHGFFCLALRRTDGAQLLIEKHERETYRRWNQERQVGSGFSVPGKQRVDLSLNLYEKTQVRTIVSL
jgi:hypothetical protein